MSSKRKGIPKATKSVTKPRKPKLSTERRKDWESIAAQQRVQPIADFDQFLEEVGAVWPEEESLDDFLAWLRDTRRARANTTPRCSRVEDRRTGANTNSL